MTGPEDADRLQSPLRCNVPRVLLRRDAPARNWIITNGLRVSRSTKASNCRTTSANVPDPVVREAALLRALQSIPDAAQRFQIPRMARVRFEFLPQAANVDIDRSRRHERGLLPHGIQQLVAREHPSPMRRQILQQAEFPDRGQHGPALDA